MKILIAHNQYKRRGGEDAVVDNEFRMLTNHGHEVNKYLVTNDVIGGFIDKVTSAINLSYSSRSKIEFDKCLDRYKPDIVHVHNLFPILTPSILDSCNQKSVPVVMTLHNYRLICPSGLMTLNGKVCERCIVSGYHNAIINRCYRKSLVGSYFVSRMVKNLKDQNVWADKLSAMIFLTEFSKQKIIRSGITNKCMMVKPNFLPSDDAINQANSRTKVLFIGRISVEKGVSLLLDAWSDDFVDLEVIGDGPLLEIYKNKYKQENIFFSGQKDMVYINNQLSNTLFIVVPSTWYEGFPMVILEAFSKAVPVVCSDIGSLSEIVDNNVNGRHFKCGDYNDLNGVIRELLQDNKKVELLGNNAYQKYKKNYTEEVNYHTLMDIYTKAIENEIN